MGKPTPLSDPPLEPQQALQPGPPWKVPSHPWTHRELASVQVFQETVEDKTVPCVTSSPREARHSGAFLPGVRVSARMPGRPGTSLRTQASCWQEPRLPLSESYVSCQSQAASRSLSPPGRESTSVEGPGAL